MFLNEVSFGEAIGVKKRLQGASQNSKRAILIDYSTCSQAWVTRKYDGLTEERLVSSITEVFEDPSSTASFPKIYFQID